jgi:phosphoribosyl 1,2-cyclic phosphodiesterase
VRLLFCGVRGSTSAPGIDFVRIGGHTSCVALAHDGEPWSLLLDAGTGIRRVTKELNGAPFRGALLLTHLHWDHVEGLPFFAAGDRDDSRVRVLVPDQGGADVADVLARAMSPPHFPIGPDGLQGTWTFEGIAPGRHRVEGFAVTAFDVPHKGGRTFGFRVDEDDGDGDGASIAYIPDHCPAPETNGAIALACAGVDLLVHDAQFVASERAVADLYGHAVIDDAIALAKQCAARTLALFHHGPARIDADVEAIGREFGAAGAGQGVDVIVAREEAVIELGGGSP